MDNIALNVKDKQEETLPGGGVKEYKPSAHEGIWYFAHPYTSKDKRAEMANFQLCCIRTAKLISLGFWVYSPICHTHPIHMAWPEFLTNDERQLWMDLDAIIIKKTEFTGIILAPLWEGSGGCNAEKKIFEKKNKPIFFYDEIIKIDE